jgi:hypothetical protein
MRQRVVQWGAAALAGSVLAWGLPFGGEAGAVGGHDPGPGVRLIQPERPGSTLAESPIRLTVQPLPSARRVLADTGTQNTAYYGLGWDGAGGTVGTVPVTAFENPEPQLWNNTPCTTFLGQRLCSGVAVGNGFQNLDRGVTGAAVIASGISDQGVENWIWAPYSAPAASQSAGGGTWMTRVTLTAHVDTILLANNIGDLSDVGVDILDQNADLPYLGQSSDTLGVGTYVDIGESFLSDTEASQAAQDILDRNLPALLTVVQSALQSEVDSALGTLSSPPTTSSAAAADVLNTLAGALAGGNYDQRTFTETFNMPAGQGVMIGFSPELMVANAGLGVTGAMAISLVQMKVTGTNYRQGTPTTIQVTPQHSNGVRYNYGSTSWMLPIYLKTTSGTALPHQPLTVTFPGSDGTQETLTCTTDQQGYCQEVLGPLAIEPGPEVPVTVSFAGTSQYLSASSTTAITENPGPTTLSLEASSPSETSEGFPAGSTVTLHAWLEPALTGARWGGSAPLGQVQFLANGTVVGRCTVQSTGSGAGCSTLWFPSLAGEPQEGVTLQAAWTGNLDWHGSASTPIATSVYIPGLWLQLAAHGTRLGQTLLCDPGVPTSCHSVDYGNRTVLTGTVYNNGQPTRGGYTVHFALGSTPIGSCEALGGSACSISYTVSTPPAETTTLPIQSWVTGPGSQPHPGVNASVTLTYYTPNWPLLVRPVSGPMTLPEAPVGLGVAGPGRLWVFVAPRAISPPDGLWLVDTESRTVLARYPLMGPVQAFATGDDGSAWAVTAAPRSRAGEEALIVRRPDGHVEKVLMPPGFVAQAIAPVSSQQAWLVGRQVGFRGVRSKGPELIALLMNVPSGIVTASAGLPGSEGTTTAPWSAVADARGLWVATNPDAAVYWVTPRGATAFHPGEAAKIDAAGINATGQGWVVGYVRSGAGAAWPITADGRLGLTPVVFGPTVNMVSAGVAVNDIGVAYLAFSAIGGTSGLPGVAGLAPDEHSALTLLPLGSLPGGGVGAETLTAGGHLWASVPFSHALWELTPTVPSS